MTKQTKRSKRRNRHKNKVFKYTDGLLKTLWKNGKLIVIDNPFIFRTKEEQKEYQNKLDNFIQVNDWINKQILTSLGIPSHLLLDKQERDYLEMHKIHNDMFDEILNNEQ